MIIFSGLRHDNWLHQLHNKKFSDFFIFYLLIGLARCLPAKPALKKSKIKSYKFLTFLLHSWCIQIIKDFLRHCPHCLLHIRSSLLSKIFQLPFLEYFFNSFLFSMVNNGWLIDIDLTIFCIVSSSLVQNWFVKYAY